MELSCFFLVLLEIYAQGANKSSPSFLTTSLSLWALFHQELSKAKIHLTQDCNGLLPSRKVTSLEKYKMYRKRRIPKALWGSCDFDGMHKSFSSCCAALFQYHWPWESLYIKLSGCSSRVPKTATAQEWNIVNGMHFEHSSSRAPN